MAVFAVQAESKLNPLSISYKLNANSAKICYNISVGGVKCLTRLRMSKHKSSRSVCETNPAPYFHCEQCEQAGEDSEEESLQKMQESSLATMRRPVVIIHAEHENRLCDERMKKYLDSHSMIVKDTLVLK